MGSIDIHGLSAIETFFLSDPVQQIAATYRMLYVSDFRELQNDANKLIVLAQDCTANP
jgi:hypothetical protein